jgi:cupin 2 domain-containing protein
VRTVPSARSGRGSRGATGGTETAGLTNLFADIPADLPEEFIQRLLSTSNLRIERIVSLGHASPEGFWYDQETHEWVLLGKGAARLLLEGAEPIDLRPGSFVIIPAHQRHRVEWTDPEQPTIWLAIHYQAGHPPNQ